jgi:uncharacterized delta-60 repeat protein
MFKEARHSFVVRLVLTLILIPGMLGIKPAQPVSAATTTVTNTNDSGAGSLRQVIASAPGTLDVTFSGDGKLPIDFGNNADIGQFVVAQPDGKLIVIGSSTPDINADFALARYNNDGSPDMTFDADGRVTTDFVRDLFGSGHDVAYAGALQSDGKLVVVGETSGGFGYYQSFAVARYNANGSLDSSFDGDGRVTTDFGNNNYGRSVAIQADGKIVVSGITSGGTTSYFALARYNANGSLDSTFDQDGKLIADFHGWGVYGGKIVLQSDGKILLAGSRTDPYNEDDFAVARYSPDGSLDTNFGGGGLVVTNIFSADDFCNSIAIQPDGKIILAGSSYDAGVSYPVMARYGTNGELDASFGTNGKVISTSNGSGMEGKAVAIQPNGKILIGDTFGIFQAPVGILHCNATILMVL